MTRRTLTRRCRLEAPADEVYRWHARPGAFERLKPPWDPARVESRSGSIEEEGSRVVLRVGRLRQRWVAEHHGAVPGREFHDRQVEGPLVAYDLPPGARWLEILEAHATSGASFLPLDGRSSDREKRALLDRARPTWLVTPEEEVAFPASPPFDPARAWAVVATSGTSGDPRLAELPRAALGSAAAASPDALEVGSADPWVCVLTPAHVGGLLVLLRGVLGGAPITVMERFDPDKSWTPVIGP